MYRIFSVGIFPALFQLLSSLLEDLVKTKLKTWFEKLRSMLTATGKRK